MLLEAGARVSARCEGSGVLHAAACVAALPGRADFGAAAVQLLVGHGAAPADRQDGSDLFAWSAVWAARAQALRCVTDAAATWHNLACPLTMTSLQIST